MRIPSGVRRKWSAGSDFSWIEFQQIIWTSQADGKVDYYNQRWFDYTGMTPGADSGLGLGVGFASRAICKTASSFGRTL